MVECELVSVIFGIQDAEVLIDTWWNVNIRVNLDIIERDLVLIDTWWNVNFL